MPATRWAFGAPASRPWPPRSRPPDARAGNRSVVCYRNFAMPATVLDGKALAARIRGDLKLETERLAAAGIMPGLAVVLVGDDPASQIYVRNKTTACAQVGIKTFDHRLPAT